MKNFSKKWTIGYTIALLAFSFYAILDTFVISSVYTVVDQSRADEGENAEAGSVTRKVQPGEEIAGDRASQKNRSGNKKKSSAKAKAYAKETEEAEASKESAAGADGETDKETVEDASKGMIKGNAKEKNSAESQITLTEYREHDTDIYVAQIHVQTVVALRTAFAQNAYGRNVTATTSQTAQNVNAMLAINGDYYGARERGYVIRNGVLYRAEGSKGQEDLVIWQDGSWSVIAEDEVTAEELVEQGAWQVWSFGPALVVDGEISVGVNDEVDRAMQANPRTAIGILENGDYVMVVSDGRTDESNGLSLYELAEFMKSLGAVTAYNLDGGGSSTMVYNGELVNNPTTTGRIKERAVSDIIYISY